MPKDWGNQTMKSLNRRAIAFLAASAMCWLAPLDAVALCADPTQCYCSFTHPTGPVFYAEVDTVDEGTLDLHLLHDPVSDPSGELSSGQLLADVVCNTTSFPPCADLTVGDHVFVSINTETQEMALAIVEQDGLFPCRSELRYPGATVEQLEQVVSADSCPEAVYDLEGFPEFDCNDQEGCSTVPTSSGGVAWLPLVCMGLLAIFRMRRQ